MVHRILIASVVGFLGISTLSVLANSTPINIDYNIARVGGYTSDPLTPAFGWPYPHAGMGTAIVTTNSADLKTDQTNAEVGALYLDTSLNTQAPAVSLSFDINVLAQAASGYGQTKTISGVATPILFGV